ncbi:MAG: condensation domain-containing protein, partial [Acidobacteriota bacterium]
RQEARPSSGVQRTLTIDLEALEARDRHRVRSKISNHLQASLDLATGSVFRVALFTPGVDGASELLLVAHHLIVDAVSWRLLLEDLGQLYQQREAGGPFELAPKTTSFQAWAKGLEARADDVGNEAVTTWQVLAAANEKDLGSSEDRSRSETYSVSRAQTHSTTLDHGLSKRLLTQVPSAYRTRTEEVLLTALLLAHQRLNGSSRLQIDLERHGREPLAGMDLARTVGWFTSVFPLGLEISEDQQPGSQLQDVKERLRAIERSGVDYGLLRYLSPSTEIRERMRGLSESRVVFNYLGQLDRGELNLAGRAVKWHRDDAIQDRSRHGHRSHGLEILAKIERGCLDVEWRFDRRWSQRQVAEWGEALLVELQGLIEHCTSVGVGRWTPSDFPLAKPSRRELDRVLVDHPRLEDLYPLSPAQEGMLFHTLSETGSGVYIEQLVIGLQGDLDSDALERSWQRVVDRHPAMRTAFAWDGLEQPMQAVVSDVAVDLVRLDWSSATEEEREVRLENLLREDRVRGHEPDRAPLMRWWLVAFGSGDIRIVWSVHHLILDGWSSPMVLEEVFSVYEAELQRRPVELPKRAPYRAYIAWLGEQDMNQAAEFWRRKLQGAAVTPLAVLDPSQQPTGASGHGELDLRLSEASAQALRALGKEHRLTLNTLVQAAWALLLYRRGGGKDLTFGITVSGRPAALQGVDGMIGMFINTLPLRLRVDPEARLGDWLREVQDCISDVRRFEHSPLVEIQRWSGLERGRPLFETLVLFYGFAESGSPRQVSERLRLTGVRGEEQTNYPFTLTALAGRELVLQINFQRGLFRDVQIRGLLQEVAALLEGFKGALDGTYQELERALRAADRQQRAARAESLGRRRAEKFKKLRRKPRRKAPIASPGASTKEVAI